MTTKPRSIRLPVETWQALEQRAADGETTVNALVAGAVTQLLGGVTQPVAPVTQPTAPKSPKSAPKAPEKAPKPAPASPQEPENDWSERMNRFSKGAQAARGSKK